MEGIEFFIVVRATGVRAKINHNATDPKKFFESLGVRFNESETLAELWSSSGEFDPVRLIRLFPNPICHVPAHMQEAYTAEQTRKRCAKRPRALFDSELAIGDGGEGNGTAGGCSSEAAASGINNPTVPNEAEVASGSVLVDTDETDLSLDV